MFSSVTVNPEKLAYKPGETIRGTVVTKVVAKEAVKGIYLTIEGREKTKIYIVRRDYNGNSTRQSSRGENYVINNKYLINDFIGDIDVGVYTIPFKIKLPSNLPNTFPREYIGSDEYGEVLYKLQAEVVVPGIFSSNWKNECFITIYKTTIDISRPVSHSDMNEKETSFCCCDEGTFTPSISAIGSVFSPGDIIVGNAEVTSKCNKKLKFSVGIMRILAYFTDESSSSSTKLITKIKMPDVPKGGKIALPFTISVPTSIMNTNHSSSLIKCHYSIVYSIGSGWFPTIENGPLITIRHPAELMDSIPPSMPATNIGNNQKDKNDDYDDSLPPAYSAKS